MQSDDENLRTRLNQETGRLSWQEIERHFARGVVVRVAPDLDLVDVAARMASDDKQGFMPWFSAGRVARASADDARDWNERDATFWAVVVAPWVLVQEIESPTTK
ncbi:MAG: hypothetical protein H6R26_1135 [Proteobacteria bacterium]|nr:hypothetical protein [Pseudomonadota bacterium]